MYDVSKNIEAYPPAALGLKFVKNPSCVPSVQIFIISWILNVSWRLQTAEEGGAREAEWARLEQELADCRAAHAEEVARLQAEAAEGRAEREELEVAAAALQTRLTAEVRATSDLSALRVIDAASVSARVCRGGLGWDGEVGAEAGA